MRNPTVGIVDVCNYVPKRFMPASEIAEASGIPENILIEKFGLIGKHISRPDEHVSDMCIEAAKPLLERHDLSEVDAVIYFGSHWKDYLVWQAAPRIQHALGIEGFALELINVSAGAPIGLKVAADMISADETLESILLVGASKESHLLDYRSATSRFLFNFGDGATAALLRKNHSENVILGSGLLTDGEFSHHVRVPGGGSVNPASHGTVDEGMHLLEVVDPEDMKSSLDPITLKNFITVSREAVEKSGREVSEIDLLLPIHMKFSLYDAILRELGLPGEKSIYLDRYGHMSAIDPLFGLAVAKEKGILAKGSLGLTLAAGTGYTWAATAIQF